MISKEHEVQIITLSREGWRKGSIARELALHPDTVQRCLDRRFSKNPECPGESDPSSNRASVLEPWVPLIKAKLEEHPNIRATRLFSMLKRQGYNGSVYPLRRYCKTHRPRPTKSFLDLLFLPGESCQVDWADFGKIKVGKHHRRLHLFIVVLAHSRCIYGHYFHDMSSARVREGQMLSYVFFGGVTRKALYDNMKTAVLEHVGDAVRFNDDLLDFAKHFGFEPVACNIRSGWEKGRVERAVRYIRESFFEARTFEDLDDLNQQLEDWLKTEAMERAWQDDSLLTVREALAQEILEPIPEEPYDPYEERFVRVDKKAMIRFDTNTYPVDPEHTGRHITIRATHSTVKVLHENKTLHCYQRLWTKYEKMRAPWHQDRIAKLRGIKAHRVSRGVLEGTLTSGRTLLLRWAELDDSLQNSSKRVLELIKQYGSEAVETAAQLALDNGTPRACSIAQILVETADAPKITPDLRMGENVPELTVEWPSTASYDDLLS